MTMIEGRRGGHRSPVASAALVAVALATAGLLGGCGGGSGADAGSGAGTRPASAASEGGQEDGPGGIGGLVSALAEATSSEANGGAGGGASGGTGSGAVAAVTSGPSGSPAAGPTRTVADSDLLFFVTPSKNIGCMISSDQVRCDIKEHNWPTPARPASCELDYGQGVYLAGGNADWVCAGDTVLASPDAVPLAYGASVTGGDFTCTSTKAGVTCRNTATGRGFTLAREAFSRF